MSKKTSHWLCCQIGAREHYAIPRALYKAGLLTHLITDAWVSPNSSLNLLPKPVFVNLRERFHIDLNQASVCSFTTSLIRFEITQKIQKNSGWQRIIQRNNWFQQKTLKLLKSIAPQTNSPPTLFAYSYAALEIFRFAKSQGWNTVLGQIDPGPVEEQVVMEEHRKYPNYESSWQTAPPKYWANWQQECSLADRIIVNSLWSSQALQKIGIPKHKIDVIPLAYEQPGEASHFVRTYPETFSEERPLRVLFLGQVLLRKGIAPLLEAAQLLGDRPIEFWVVGSQGIAKPQQHLPRVHWFGAVPRSLTSQYYQQADVFLFPTLSDGFGLTQLEAQAWKLPIIASQFCGTVVKNYVNGLLLEEVTGEEISMTLQLCLHNPQLLKMLSQQSANLNSFSLSQLQCHLQTLSYAVV
ncbi:glycosyltransferase family 4 protein [Scytonema sp. NUACC21]